ncbi:MAG: Fe-S cluster assembly protein SufD [Alphaproteobacteria bacterium]|nr:Fe-S cluster assembly protein SufD [Alphaproteobacteria bacterium]
MGLDLTPPGLSAERFLSEGEPLAGGPAWLAALRQQATLRLRVEGLPANDDEGWRQTPLAALKRFPLGGRAAAVATPASSLLRAEERAARLVFRNGALQPAAGDMAALPAGVTLASLAELWRAEPARLAGRLGRLSATEGLPFAQLNLSLAADGYALLIDDGVRLERPVEIVFAGDGEAAWHPRVLIALGRDSTAAVLECHVGRGAYLANGVSELLLAAGARLGYCRVQDEAPAALHLHAGMAELAGGARLDSVVLSLGGGLARNEWRVRLAGEGAEVRLDEVFALRGRQQGETISVIEHLAPHTGSAQVAKGVLDGHARKVFQGKIAVASGAAKAAGSQLNKTLLLSRTAEVASKPELEINCDDVQCSHGAAVGALDEDQLFYLRSRGVPLLQAQALLVDGFLDQVVETVALPTVAAALRARIAAWLAEREGNGT